MPEGFNEAMAAEAAKFNRRPKEREEVSEVIFLPKEAITAINDEIRGAVDLPDLVDKLRNCMIKDEVKEGISVISDVAFYVEGLSHQDVGDKVGVLDKIAKRLPGVELYIVGVQILRKMDRARRQGGGERQTGAAA